MRDRLFGQPRGRCDLRLVQHGVPVRFAQPGALELEPAHELGGVGDDQVGSQVASVPSDGSCPVSVVDGRAELADVTTDRPPEALVVGFDLDAQRERLGASEKLPEVDPGAGTARVRPEQERELFTADPGGGACQVGEERKTLVEWQLEPLAPFPDTRRTEQTDPRLHGQSLDHARVQRPRRLVAAATASRRRHACGSTFHSTRPTGSKSP